jgi:hypothetical protein
MRDAYFDEVLELVRDVIADGESVIPGTIVHIARKILESDDHPNYEQVRDLLWDANRMQDPNAYACEIAQKIMDLK